MTDFVRRILEAISIEQIRGHIQALEGVRHPVTAPEALERAANYIQSILHALNFEITEHHFTEDNHDYRNILGLHQGTRYPGKKVIVLAHYDTEPGTPGANDNASGIAAMLELARVCQPLTFEASILFAGVTLEEIKWGVKPEEVRFDQSITAIARGSQALAAYARANTWDIQGVIDLEEIAFAGDSVIQKTPTGMPVNLPEAGNFIGVIGNDHSAGLVKGFNESIVRNHIPLPLVPLIVPGNGEALPDTRRSDHAPFWDAGYKAIMITDTANFRTPHYHHASDTLETLNLVFAADVCRATTGLVLTLAGLVESQ